jgi:lipopolysaccharide export system ATP-binding protein
MTMSALPKDKPSVRIARPAPGEPTAKIAPLSPGLVANNLAKEFRKRPVLRGVSVSVRRGEVVGLLGPNGAGKTTCFYIITGLIKADDGAIVLDGVDVTDLPMYRRARLGIGYLPQEASVFRGLTVEENIRAVLEIVESAHDQRESRLEELLSEFSSDIRSLVSHLKDRGIGVLVTDHNVRDTLDIVDRAYILYEGKVLREGRPSEIVDDETVRRVYLGEKFSL